MMVSALTSVAALIVAMQNAPDDPALRTAQKLARRCAEATVKKDFEEVVDLSHPAAIKVLGGRTRAIKLIKEQLEKSEKDGVKLLSVKKVGLPEKIYPSKTAHYCVVPIAFQIMIDEKMSYLKTALIGISIDKGKAWKFVDISLGEEAVRKFLPELPADLEFPPKAEMLPDDQ